MKPTSHFKKTTAVLARGCIITVAVLFCAFAVAAITAAAKGRGEPVINFSSFLAFVFFSFVLALSKEILSVRTLPPAVCRLLHFLAVGLAFLLIYIIRTEKREIGTYLIAFLLYAAVYGVLWLLFLLFKRLFAKKRPSSGKSEGSSSYTSMFS